MKDSNIDSSIMRLVLNSLIMFTVLSAKMSTIESFSPDTITLTLTNTPNHSLSR